MINSAGFFFLDRLSLKVIIWMESLEVIRISRNKYWSRSGMKIRDSDQRHLNDGPSMWHPQTHMACQIAWVDLCFERTSTEGIGLLGSPAKHDLVSDENRVYVIWIYSNVDRSSCDRTWVVWHRTSPPDVKKLEL